MSSIGPSYSCPTSASSSQRTNISSEFDDEVDESAWTEQQKRRQFCIEPNFLTTKVRSSGGGGVDTEVPVPENSGELVNVMLTDEEEEEMAICSRNKRMKLAEAKQQRPSLATSSRWWKQQSFRRNSDQLSYCHICQNPYASYLPLKEGDEELTRTQSTILSYFPPVTSVNTRTSIAPQQVQQPSTPTNRRQCFLASQQMDSMRTVSSSNSSVVGLRGGCIVCDRTNICTNCLVQCEECNACYCTFCAASSDNISGRTLCMECVAVYEKRNHQQHRTDAMASIDFDKDDQSMQLD